MTDRSSNETYLMEPPYHFIGIQRKRTPVTRIIWTIKRKVQNMTDTFYAILYMHFIGI